MQYAVDGTVYKMGAGARDAVCTLAAMKETAKNRPSTNKKENMKYIVFSMLFSSGLDGKKTHF